MTADGLTGTAVSDTNGNNVIQNNGYLVGSLALGTGESNLTNTKGYVAGNVLGLRHRHVHEPRSILGRRDGQRRRDDPDRQLRATSRRRQPGRSRSEEPDRRSAQHERRRLGRRQRRPNAAEHPDRDAGDVQVRFRHRCGRTYRAASDLERAGLGDRDVRAQHAAEQHRSALDLDDQLLAEFRFQRRPARLFALDVRQLSRLDPVCRQQRRVRRAGAIDLRDSRRSDAGEPVLAFEPGLAGADRVHDAEQSPTKSSPRR